MAGGLLTAARFFVRYWSMLSKKSPFCRWNGLRGPSGARDEFHLAAIVQNLKTLARTSAYGNKALPQVTG
jgi:hypothetical protein